MAGTTRRAGIRILNGAATLNPPTAARSAWAINWTDPLTGKQRNASGGKSREEAELRAKDKLGWSVPEHLRKGAAAPSLRETYDAWRNQNSSRWNSRTADNYEYCSRRFLDKLGERGINTISPIDIERLEVRHLSREQQKKTRTLLRGIFGMYPHWMLHDAEKLAQAVSVSGTKSADKSRTVPKGDIPTAEYVNSVILCAYSTLQESPIGNVETQERDWKTDPHHFSAGLPIEVSNLQRRGIPKHYKNIPEREEQESIELASRFRQYGLITALGAGGGLRIGEVLALRVRHFLNMDELPTETLSFGNETGHLWMNYRGKIEVAEQASQASKGKIWLTAPKGGRERVVHLPALLQPTSTVSTFYGRKTIREQVSTAVEKYADPRTSLWELNQDEAITLWKLGYPPLAYLLWQRLAELWNSEVIRSISSEKKQYEAFSKLLLFPTRNKARLTASGIPQVQFESNWGHDASIVEGTGTYHSSTNLAGRYMNPLYDYVSEEMNYYPSHRKNAAGRKGWTHHGLRHYAIQSWIESPANIPLPQISENFGHSSVEFTLQRYAHAASSRKIPQTGFEY